MLLDIPIFSLVNNIAKTIIPETILCGKPFTCISSAHKVSLNIIMHNDKFQINLLVVTFDA